MELKTKLFTILAIFCILCSACAVSAVDYGYYDYDDGYYDYDDGYYDYDDIYDDDYYHYAAAHNQSAVNSNAPVHVAAGNTANASHGMPITANPILALMAVGAVIGGVVLLKRK